MTKSNSDMCARQCEARLLSRKNYDKTMQGVTFDLSQELMKCHNECIDNTVLHIKMVLFLCDLCQYNQHLKFIQMLHIS